MTMYKVIREFSKQRAINFSQGNNSVVVNDGTKNYKLTEDSTISDVTNLKTQLAEKSVVVEYTYPKVKGLELTTDGLFNYLEGLGCELVCNIGVKNFEAQTTIVFSKEQDEDKEEVGAEKIVVTFFYEDILDISISVNNISVLDIYSNMDDYTELLPLTFNLIKNVLCSAEYIVNH